MVGNVDRHVWSRIVLFCFWTNLSLAFTENLDRTNRKKNGMDDERTTSRLFVLYTHKGKYSGTCEILGVPAEI